MKKVLLSLLLLIPLLGPAQNPQLNQQFSFTTTQATAAIDIRGRGLNYFRIAWDFNGNTFPSACSIQLQISSFGTLWTTAATGTCTSQGQSAFVQASANFIRLNLITFTPASAGDLVVNITGFTTNPSGGGAASTVNIQATNGDALTATANSLNVNCTGGCSSSPSPADNSAFTAGTTGATPIQGFYHSVRDSLTDGRSGAIALNINRAVLTQLEDSSKNAIGSTGNALDINIKSGSIANTAFTANAGTNLNTSLLALETGGNLAASKTNLDTIVTNTTGLATSTNQTTGNTSLSTIATNTTGAATATNQTTGNISLTSIVTNTTNSARETGGQLERLNQQITSLIKAQPTVNPLNKSVPVTIINPIIADPCQNKKIFVAISQTATAQLVNAIPGWSIYICGILVVGADAENVSLVYGTGTTCGTGTIAMIGGTSAANGPNLAANGGFNQGFANASISYAIPGQNVCLQQSGAGRVAGNLSYVISSN